MRKNQASDFRENHEYYQAQLAADIQYKKKKQRVRKIRFFGWSFLGLTLFLSLFFPYLDQKEKLRQAEENYTEISKDLERLEKEAALKEEQIENLNNDEYIADLARRDFFMSKDGEVIYSTIKDD